MKERLDILLVKRGLAESREKAKAAIMSGAVFVNGECRHKAGETFDENAVIEIKGEIFPFVSRGGLKLKKAVEVFNIDLKDKICMDVGASTGGFTDCMLQNGAAKVYSVDVGHGQLAGKLLDDGRVVNMEGFNIRYITPDDITDVLDFVSIDVSFISLTKVLIPIKALMKDGAYMVCLIKPQFEAGKSALKKGIVRDKKVHESVIKEVWNFAQLAEYSVINLEFSPIKGPEGNIEYLIYLKNESGKSEMEISKAGAVVEMSHKCL